MPSVAHRAHFDRHRVAIAGEKELALRMEPSIRRWVLGALTAPNPLFEISVNRCNDLRTGEEEWPCFAIDGRIGAHHRFFTNLPVVGQIVVYQEPCDLQGL